jgi:hypothetical protein
MKEYCPRCGKEKHKGPCTFDKAKKSVVETLKDTATTNATAITELKAKVK